LKLLFSAVIKFIIGLILAFSLLFVPAGSLAYTNAWLFICLLFIPMFIFGIILYIKAPDLLKKRLDTKEKENPQKGVVALSGILFFAGFIVAGLDFRLSWSKLPTWLIITASAVLLLGYGLYAEVMRENAYLSRVIEIQDNQKVIDTGLYGIVRHPMYAATILLFLSIPIVLGSFWSFLFFLPYLPIIAVRIINEEKVLESGLAGYSEYKKRVKYRLIPFIW